MKGCWLVHVNYETHAQSFLYITYPYSFSKSEFWTQTSFHSKFLSIFKSLKVSGGVKCIGYSHANNLSYTYLGYLEYQKLTITRMTTSKLLSKLLHIL